MGIDQWFLEKLFHIHKVKQALNSFDFKDLSKNTPLLREAKCCGFSDQQIAAHLRPMAAKSPKEPFSTCKSPKQRINPWKSPAGYEGGPVCETHIRSLRKEAHVLPVVKQIDTLAAEFPAETNYL